MKNLINLSHKNIYKNIITFGSPIFFSLVLQALYNIIDMLVVGRYVGSAGTAAIGSVSSVICVINAISVGIAIGGTVLVSQYNGRKDKQSQIEIINTLLGMTLIVSVIITVLSFLFYKPLLSLIGVPAESMKYACEYMIVTSIGCFFLFSYNSICSVMKGLGNSKCLLYFALISTILHVILDIFFVATLNIGPVGAAISAIICECILFIVSFIFLKKLYFKNIKLTFFSLKKEKTLTLLRIGLPTIVQMSFVNLSFLFVTGMLNSYGVVIASAAGIGMKILSLMTKPGLAVGQTVCVMVGQSMGEENIKRTREIGKAGIKLNIFINLFIVIVFQLFAKQIVAMFDTNPDVIYHGVLFIRICGSLDCIMYAVMFTYNMFAVATGCYNLGLYNSLVDSVFVRMIVCYILGFVLGFGFVGIYIGVAVSSVIPAIIGFIYFKKGKWNKEQSKTTYQVILPDNCKKQRVAS